MSAALAGIAETTVEVRNTVPSRRCLSFIRVLPSCSAACAADFSPAAYGTGIAFSFARLIGERPHPQLLLADLPQAREPVRLDDQEEDDERAHDHELQLFDRRRM